ncbi:uncharacterized protein [Asterias amurensis]|uniref:uncharacterized protein n=1 Tax=Asterias amurensis TaxID=7602 RepID=UPI003AB4816F
MRKRQSSLLKDNLHGCLRPMLLPSNKATGVNGKVTVDVPFVFVKDLLAMILDYLERHQSKGSLTWRNGVIPENEIWIKVGGDKGGTSFKLDFQIANTHRPNSYQNTVVFACFEAPDSSANLQCLIPILEQLSSLQRQTWREKIIRTFVFGDYELLTKIYGICSCNAHYCCLYCHTSKADMQAPLEEQDQSVQYRSLASLAESYKAYQEDGCRKVRAKDVSNSVIAKAMIPVEIDQTRAKSSQEIYSWGRFVKPSTRHRPFAARQRPRVLGKSSWEPKAVIRCHQTTHHQFDISQETTTSNLLEEDRLQKEEKRSEC